MSVVWGKYLVSRALNLALLHLSYALSLVGIVWVRHMPTFASVEPANFCNLHCPECPVGNAALRRGKRHEPHLLSIETYARFLSEIAPYAHTIQFYFQGEPLLHPDLPKMIQMAREYGLFTIVSTNAQLLSDTLVEQLIRSGLNRIIVSVDGFTAQSYQAYRQGGDLHRALVGLATLQRYKRSLHAHTIIELQVLKLRSNEAEWPWIKQHYRSLGADRLVFKTAQLYNYAHGHALMPTHARDSRYVLGGDGVYYLRRPNYRSCYRLWSGCVLNTYGQILPCCYDKDSAHILGSIPQVSLPQIWHSVSAKQFRRQVIKDKTAFPMCQECFY